MKYYDKDLGQYEYISYSCKNALDTIKEHVIGKGITVIAGNDVINYGPDVLEYLLLLYIDNKIVISRPDDCGGIRDNKLPTIRILFEYHLKYGTPLFLSGIIDSHNAPLDMKTNKYILNMCRTHGIKILNDKNTSGVIRYPPEFGMVCKDNYLITTAIRKNMHELLKLWIEQYIIDGVPLSADKDLSLKRIILTTEGYKTLCIILDHCRLHKTSFDLKELLKHNIENLRYKTINFLVNNYLDLFIDYDYGIIKISSYAGEKAVYCMYDMLKTHNFKFTRVRHEDKMSIEYDGRVIEGEQD